MIPFPTSNSREYLHLLLNSIFIQIPVDLLEVLRIIWQPLGTETCHLILMKLTLQKSR